MKSLNEFIESYEYTKFLDENLVSNMETFGDQMSKQDQDSLMRMNWIMIRQCLNQFGIK